MKAAWNPPNPIKDLWKQLKEGHEIAEQGGEEMSDAQMVCILYKIINDTGFFAKVCKDWCETPAGQKIFHQMQIYFTKEVDTSLLLECKDMLTVLSKFRKMSIRNLPTSSTVILTSSGARKLKQMKQLRQNHLLTTSLSKPPTQC